MGITTKEDQLVLQQRVRALFEKQRAFAPQLALSTAKERLGRLRRIETYLRDEDNIRRLEAALRADLSKPSVETMASEVWVVLTHLRHIRRNLRRWMRPERVPKPFTLLGTTSYIHYEPKGMALIISPWNYPFNLAMIPVIYAIAAGCTVTLKPSEFSPHCSAFLRRMLGSLFDEQEVGVVEGDEDVARLLTAQPFNHIYFTGSTAVGKKVMEAASRNLAGVTLELGGKSPAIVDASVDVEAAAERTAWAKHFNAGQTCIAPDYLIVHESIREPFLQAYQTAVERFYNPDGQGIQSSADFARMIGDKHFDKVQSLFKDAVEKGARVLMGGEFDKSERYVAPTVLTEVTEEMDVLKEEIFGPLLPVLVFHSRDELINIIKRRPKPLTMYLNSRDQDFIEYVIRHTSAGGTLINEYLLGYSNPNLPFGGVNHSGIGKGLGRHGFREFSNERSIMHRHWGTISMAYPPYTGRVKEIVHRLFRWF